MPLLACSVSGHIVTTSYKAPKGGYFDSFNVSSPHYFAELLIHLSIALSLGLSSPTWWVLTLSVGSHLFYLAFVSHRLYVRKFDDYPKNRKLLIPFLL